MLKEVIKITEHPPLISCRCGSDELSVSEHVYEGDGERLMPVHYVQCATCCETVGGAHTSLGEACVRWNSRMIS